MIVDIWESLPTYVRVQRERARSPLSRCLSDGGEDADDYGDTDHQEQQGPDQDRPGIGAGDEGRDYLFNRDKDHDADEDVLQN